MMTYNNQNSETEQKCTIIIATLPQQLIFFIVDCYTTYRFQQTLLGLFSMHFAYK